MGSWFICPRIQNLVTPAERCWSGPGAVKKIHHRSLPFTTVHHRLTTVRATPYTLGHRSCSLLPLRKFWTGQNIGSGYERLIFRYGKVHNRSNNAQSPFDIAMHKLVDVWDRKANAEILNASSPPSILHSC